MPAIPKPPTPRRPAVRGPVCLVALLASAAAGMPATALAAEALPDARFTPIQPELFAVPGSLANAWADFDGDGDPDLAVSGKDGAIRLYRNDAGRFLRVNDSVPGLPAGGEELRGLSFGDFDGDGDPDLFAGSNVSPIPSRSYLYRNDAGERFVEVAEALGATVPGRSSRQANFVDFDGDGDLDLYAAHRAGVNRLLRNDGGTFSTLPYAYGAQDIRRTVGACWFDFDADGDLDLFLANQSGDSDALWRNDGDRFVDVAPALGLDQTLRTVSEGGVGCAPGDFDNDGDPDLYVGTYGHNLLYRNAGDGTFEETAAALGVDEPHSVVGAAWGDYDNDGDLDLFVAAYHRVDGVQQPLDRLFRNDGDRFVNVLPADSPLNAGDHGVAWVDYDGDGDLDLSLTDGYGDVGGHPVFRNELAPADRGRGFAVRVLDAAGRPLEAGAEVRLYDGSGRLLGLRLVDTGGGYNAQNVVDVHLVAPRADAPVSVAVTFMGRNGGVVHRVGPFTPDALEDGILEVRRPVAGADR